MCLVSAYLFRKQEHNILKIIIHDLKSFTIPPGLLLSDLIIFQEHYLQKNIVNFQNMILGEYS